MSTITLILIICLFILIVLSGFLSGSETALTATSKPRILLKLKKGNKRAEYVLKILNNLDNVISSLLLSNNLVNILASSLATAVLYDLFGVSGIVYATLIMTILIVIFAEILPKTYSLNRPTRTSLLISPIIYYLSKILYPIIFLINLIVKNIFLRNQKNDSKIKDEQSEEELQGVIDMYKTSSPDSEHEKDMLQSILTLNDTTVEEVFTHRKNIYSIDGSLDISEIIKKINMSRFTRIPVWKENPENIIGLLNVRTLNIDLSNKESSKEIIFEKISKPWFIPETTNLLEQLVAFRNRKEHIAFIVDEFGELLGLITLEDIIEEIVGEIVDEIDAPDEEFKKNNDGLILTNGEKNLRDLYKYFDHDLTSSEASTISGHILNLAKRIPLYGEAVKDEYFIYKILSHSRKQISKIEITPIR
ncbi:CNNM domain-containing protein [Alphaproteobacteria bacterium]|nr:CNNM domain-containing protein [Alphaproteobacteria bacterium]